MGDETCSVCGRVDTPGFMCWRVGHLPAPEPDCCEHGAPLDDDCLACEADAENDARYDAEKEGRMKFEHENERVLVSNRGGALEQAASTAISAAKGVAFLLQHLVAKGILSPDEADEIINSVIWG